MAGGVLKDAMDEAGIRGGNKPPPDETMAFDEGLRRLKQLRDDGLISEQEYESTKKKILESARAFHPRRPRQFWSQRPTLRGATNFRRYTNSPAQAV